MQTRPASARIVTNVLAVLVLAGSVVLLVVVPHEWLRPLSVACALLAALAVFGIRAYLRRLEGVVSFLSSTHPAEPAAQLAALLSEAERRLLLVRRPSTTAEINDLLRRRQAALRTLAMGLAVPGICAFLVALYFFSD